ncbi:hypothetical protein FOT57_24175 [Serratia ureilytica]|uniref:MrpH family fimbial adhesin n=1 Tax=Serratia ureilytica TaxID=300181 RepID=UPI0011CB142D|nr:hypothetical protein [Serratia ureilytica]TXE50117.1 hypothetical protein FOT57_24175 [Serratia ureilytica]
MKYLLRYLFAVFLTLWVGICHADVKVQWEPSSDGKTLRFTVLSATPNPFPAEFTLKCGLFSTCYVDAHVGLLTEVYRSPNIASSPGTQKASTLIAAWAARSPVGFIGNWGELVEKNGGQPPCIIFNLMGGVSGSGSFGSTCNGSVNPPEPPKPPVSCYMIGDIYLRHGSLADSEVTGNRAESTAYVYCTGAAKVKVRALAAVGSDSYTVNLRADGSLKSMLSVNGVVGNSGVTLNVPGAGGNTVTFSSLLIAAGIPAPGDFSGSAVAVVDIL